MEQTWFAVVNPQAGGGKVKTDWPKIKNCLNETGVKFVSAFTEFKCHAVQITVDAINHGYRKFIAVGGDGTLNEVINGIFIQKQVPTTDLVVGVIAVGSGNDWFRMYRYPSNYLGQAQILLNGKAFEQDVGMAQFVETGVQKTRYFVNSAGSGFDAKVVESTSNLKIPGNNGKRSYVWSLLKALINYHSTRVRVAVDDFCLHETVFSLSCGIGRYSGEGMQQSPKALTDDGLFDMTIIRKLSKLNVIASIPMLYNGSLLKHARVMCVRGREVNIQSEPPIDLEVDGEMLGQSPFRFTILPRAIRVMVNPQCQQCDRQDPPTTAAVVLSDNDV